MKKQVERHRMGWGGGQQEVLPLLVLLLEMLEHRRAGGREAAHLLAHPPHPLAVWRFS